MVEFTEFERAKGNGQYETMVPLDEARAEIERLEKEVEALKAGRDMLGNFWDKAKQEADTAWNDAIEAAVQKLEFQSGCIGLDQDGCPYVGEDTHLFASAALHHAAADILALKRPQENTQK